jgi:site-specific DNA-methyltransferase (adenine-specific)
MVSDNNIYIRPVCEMILLHSKGRYYYDGGTGRRGKREVPWLDETKDVWWNVPAHKNGHPAPFPVEIPSRLIQLFTCTRKRVPIVLDPFCGSGTTGVACIQTGRNFIGIELDAGYCEIARRRCAAAEMQGRLL